MKARLKVYQYAYRARITESLVEDFVRLKKFLGAKSFAALVKKFVEGPASRHRSLGELSSDFAHSIKNPRAYGFAMRDWLEIESRMADGAFNSREGFIILHPSVRVYLQSPRIGYVFFCLKREFREKKLSGLDLLLFKSFGKKREISVASLVKILEKKRVAPPLAKKLFFRWARLGLIKA